MTLINELLEKAEKGIDRKNSFIVRASHPPCSSNSDHLSDSFSKVINFISGIQDKPVPVQIGVGSAIGWVTGYVFTKGSKVVAGVLGCSLILLQISAIICTAIVSEMDRTREYAVNVITTARPYIHYFILPLGLYAVNRLFSSLIPGPQHYSKLDLRDRTVLITGASSGLGRELAICFYRRGAKVILTARSIDLLREICEELKSLPNVVNENEPVYKYLDISDPNGVVELVSLSMNQRIDVLVNNAGLSMRGSCKDTPMDVHRQIMEVNYFGHVAVTKALLDYIPEDGAVVYISSLQGRIAVPFRSSYSASKHAAQAFFDCLRTEERFNTQVLVVSTTYMNTGFGRRALTAEGKRMDKDDPNQFSNFRGYIKFNQSKLRRDIEQFRKDITRMAGNRNTISENDVSDFLRNNMYLLSSYTAGFLLGYTFA